MKFRFLLFALLIGCCLPVFGQDYDNAEVIFEMMSEHAENAEFFEDRSKPFQLEQYKLSASTDALEFNSGCLFSFMENDIIQTRVLNKKSKLDKKNYWVWIETKDGDPFGHIEACTKKGAVINPWGGFTMTETMIVNSDSIVDRKSCVVNSKGDTSCSFNKRWIYRNDTLVEFWRDDNYTNLTWEESKSYIINKYTYPAQGTTVTERFSGTEENLERIAKLKKVKAHNEEGKLSSVIFSRMDSGDSGFSENRYFYEDGRWTKTERWYNGNLTEKIIIRFP